MSAQALLLSSFLGVTLHNGTAIRQVAPYEMDGDQAVTRLHRLSNGTIFDADGSADGSKAYGKIRVVFRVTGTTHTTTNTAVATLEALLNRRGSLVGVEYGASSGTNKTCTARCLVARPMPRAGMPMATGRQFQVEIEMVFQRFTAYS